jgi:penicillin-binding protein 2
MVRLSVVEGAERLAEAESRLDIRTFLPTNRGRILDRHGRVLAIDRASCDVAVEYSVITGTWVRSKARRQAIDDVGRSKWNEMSPDEREALVVQFVPQWTAVRERLWSELCRMGDISPADLQRRLDEIKAKVQSTAATVWERQRAQQQMMYGISADEFKPSPILEQREAHVILPQVSDEVAFAFRKMEQDMPGMVEVQDSTRREYPWINAEVFMLRHSLPRPILSESPITLKVTGVADHILGAMRSDVWETDVKRRPFNDPVTNAIDLGGYRESGEKIGSRGIERTFEDHLRGMRGEIRERKDTGQQNRTEAVPGRDLQMTLDIALQARVQAILSPELGLTRVQPWQRNAALPLGTPLNAAAVVIEVATGEILAMVSMPTIAMGAQMSPEQQQMNQPMVNRPVEAIYPPGSILKPLVLAGAVSEGVFNIESAINCTGHYFPEKKDVARCWIYREQYNMQTHGPLRASEALARSCNIYFYTLADRLGMDRLLKSLRSFGLDAALNVGLAYAEELDGRRVQFGESRGSLPNDAKLRVLREQGGTKFSEVIMGIGQGPITWTPVQAANAFATIARGGTIRDATLIANQEDRHRPQRRDDLKLSPKLVDEILEGLRQSVMERHGTGHHITHSSGDEEPIINAVGVQVWAKTGTAQADKSRGLDHSWFVGMVGPKDANRPMHAIAVLVENGGSGGRTAGPIANQIIRALQAEGYLPGDHNAAPLNPRRAWTPQPEFDHEDEEDSQH